MRLADLHNSRPLRREFFDRDPVTVARELLGKLLIRRDGGKLMAGRIVEDEAYLGTDDPAAHAYSGWTQRNAVLFGPPGHAYVYFIYGNHYCLNVSCMPEGDAGSVLFRAMEPVFGIHSMANERGVALSQKPTIVELRRIASGPGRMAQALGITRMRDNGKDLVAGEPFPHAPADHEKRPLLCDLWLADDGQRPRRIAATERIGITKASDRPLRFIDADSLFLSGKRAVKP
jgi:DNA-3-methyladenine glycosylase